MYIVDQDRSNVVNIGNIKSIALSGKRITADDYTLAAYDAVNDLAMDHSIIMVRGNGQADITAYSCGVYYMPEE